MIPVELFLQQVQACVQLVALLPAQALQRRVEGRRGGQAAAGNLLVLTTPPTLPPETKDVGHTREGTCGRRRQAEKGRESECLRETQGRNCTVYKHVGVLFCCMLPERALQVFPVLWSPSPSVFSLNFMGAA